MKSIAGKGLELGVMCELLAIDTMLVTGSDENILKLVEFIRSLADQNANPGES